MINKEILHKVIEKAEKNGYFNGFYKMIMEESNGNYNENSLCFEYSGSVFKWSLSSYNIIFSHDFAKAFWGRELVIIDDHGSKIPNWENELMQMVRYKEPLKYLEKFLKD